jgi:phage terminase small subunit
MAKLTERQQRFVKHYTGNATEAAKLAGYSEKSAHYQGCILLKNPKILKALENKKDRASIVQATLHQELYDFWKMMMKDAEGDNNRLKASEMLAKAEAMFVQRHEVEDVTKRPLKDRMYGAIQQILKDPEGRKMIKEAAEGLNE